MDRKNQSATVEGGLEGRQAGLEGRDGWGDLPIYGETKSYMQGPFV